MTRYTLLLIVIATVLLDWGVKWLVYERMQYGISLSVWQLGDWALSFTRAHNYGAAFSFLANQGGWQRILFLLIGLLAIWLITGLIRDLPRDRIFSRFGLALIIGGAIGNMGDRLILGYVVDYIDVVLAGWNFFIFNIADIAISVGASIWVLDQFFHWRKIRSDSTSNELKREKR